MVGDVPILEESNVPSLTGVSHLLRLQIVKKGMDDSPDTAMHTTITGQSHVRQNNCKLTQ